MIPHNRPTLGQPEKAAALRVLDSGWVAQGPEVQRLEEQLCELMGLGTRCAVAVSSGTAALFLALWALGAKGKRVAIPVYSCAALRNAVLMAGALPVPVDIALDSPNIDVSAAAAGGADMLVAAHMFGMPIVEEIASLRIPVIEDCAQALGARADGRPVGLLGAAAVFSFYATKMLTSGGQGGMFVSRDESLAEAVRDYRNFDQRADRRPRFNLQMTDLQAAVGGAQLAQLQQFIGRRHEIYSRYRSRLALWPGEPHIDAEPCYYRAIMRVPDPGAAIARLERRGVRAIVPIADWELLDDAERYPRAAALTRSTLSLPIYPTLTRSELDTVIAAAADQPTEIVST